MGKIVGTVTRRAGNLKPFIARLQRDGSTIGPFKSLGDAKAALQRVFGSRRLRWRRDDLGGTVESYRGEDPEFLPNDLDGMIMWMDASQGVRLLDPDSTNVVEWGDYSQSGNPLRQTTTALQPDLQLAGPGGRPTLEVGISLDQTMVSAVALMADFTVIVVATAAAPAGPTKVALQMPSASPYIIGTETSGWKIENGAGTLKGVAVSAGTVGMVTGRQSASVGEFFFDGVAIDSNASAPVPGATVELGSVTAGPLEKWGGSVSAVLLYRRRLADPELATLHAYLKQRYGIA